MKRMILSVICLLPVCTLTAAPLDKAQIGSSAKWLIHLDLDAFKKSSLGTLITNEIQSEHQPQIEALAELLGSNPLQDIDQITLYGQDSNEKNAVLMVWGRFNSAKLLALPALHKTYQKTPYRDYTLHEWGSEDIGKNQVGVFARDNLIILSQTRRPVEQALDVLDGKIPALAGSDNLSCLDKAPAAPIFLLAAEDLGQLTGANAHAAILKNSEALVFIADEVNQYFSLTLNLWAQEAQTAVQIEQILLGIKAFMLLNQKTQPELAQLLQSFQFQREDTLISIRFQYPSEALFSILKQHKDLQEGLKKEFRSDPEQEKEHVKETEGTL